MCPQRVQHNVTMDRDVALSGKQVMCAVTFTFKITVHMNDSNSVCGEFYTCSPFWFVSIIIQFLRARANIHNVLFDEGQKCMFILSMGYS